MTIAQARQIVGKNLGFGANFTGEVGSYSAISPTNQLALNKGVAEYIVLNQSSFSSDQVQQAKNILGRPSDPGIQDTSFDYGMFFDEVGKNARAINPLDSQNIVKTILWVSLMGLGAFAIYTYVNRKTN